MKNDEKHIVCSTITGEPQLIKKSEVPFVVRSSRGTAQEMRSRADKEGNTNFSVMLFFRANEIVDTDSRAWVNTKTMRFRDAFTALNCYADTACPASQLIRAKSAEELKAKEKEMLDHYKDEAWLEENLYPYI